MAISQLECVEGSTLTPRTSLTSGPHRGSRQRPEIERDQGGRVLGGGPAFRHDDRDRLADMAHLVVGKQRLLRIEERVLDLRGPFLRQRELGVGDGRQEAREVDAGERIDDAWRRGGAGKIDRADARMGKRAAHEGGVQHAGKAEVGDVEAAPGEEARVLTALEGAADVGGWGWWVT
jgi:hypothetical protein